MRLFGITQIQATRSSKAVYVLPVPMGSPQNYYGDFGSIRYATAAETVTTVTTLHGRAQAAHRERRRRRLDQAQTTCTQPRCVYTTDTVSGHQEAWKTFTGLTVPAGATVLGLQLVMNAKAATAVNCTVTAALSWNGGTNYSTAEVTTVLTSTRQGLRARRRQRHLGPHMGRGRRSPPSSFA